MTLLKRLAAAWPFVRRPPLWCTLGICAVLLIARRPSSVVNPQFWAEDGRVFFTGAFEQGLETLFAPSAGYLQFTLRLVAWSATRLDVVLAPAAFVAGTIALTVYVAARTQSSRFPFPASCAYALALVLLPNAGEVYLNLTNLQWILAAGLLVVLISGDAETVRQWIHDLVAVAVLGLTGPFVIVGAPLFVWRAWVRRSAISTWLAVIALGGAAIQGAIIYRTSLTAPGPVAWEYVLGTAGVRIGALLGTGDWLGSGMGVGWASLFGVLTLAGVAGLAGWRDHTRIERVWLALTCVALVALGLYRCHSDLGALFYGAAGRYFFVPRLLVVWLLIAASGGAVAAVALVARAFLVTTLIATAVRFTEPPLKDLEWPLYAARIRSGQTTTVPANPDDAWSFTVRRRAGDRAPEAVGTGPNVSVPLNCSVRAHVSPQKPAILGFVVGGDADTRRTVLIRGVGPSLAKRGVGRPLARPKLVLLRNGIDYRVDFRPNRASSAQITAATERSGAFPLDAGSDDVVAITTLESGGYGVVATSDSSGESGELLIEVYELPPDTARAIAEAQ